MANPKTYAVKVFLVTDNSDKWEEDVTIDSVYFPFDNLTQARVAYDDAKKQAGEYNDTTEPNNALNIGKGEL